MKVTEQGSNMIKSVSSEREHLQECGECAGMDETPIREFRDLLQSFSQEMKVAVRWQQIFVFNLPPALYVSIRLLRRTLQESSG